jgi:archaemetzincin
LHSNLPKAVLDVVPLGPIDALMLSIVAAHIQSLMGLPTDIVAERPKPDYAFLETRGQYDATKIIAQLFKETEGAYFKLGFIASDLCIPILTYVYGESQLGGRVAVVSIDRLRDRDRQVTYERAAKISLHEVGHLLGLEHCLSAGCLMRFSKQVDQLDELPLHVCPACNHERTRRLASLSGIS